MSKYIYLIDPGHGGMIGDRYVTAPSKMVEYDDGFVIYEGVVNRAIAGYVCAELDQLGIAFLTMADSQKDTPLSERVRKADDLQARYGNCIYISIHLNAGGGRGYEIFTSVGQTTSDKVAEYFFDSYEKEFPEMIQRTNMTDGDRDKEAHFYVLRKTDCPAILIESGFMDRRREAEWLNSDEGQKAIAKAIIGGILNVEKFM